jgi:hypothetical protein
MHRQAFQITTIFTTMAFEGVLAGQLPVFHTLIVWSLEPLISLLSCITR